MEYNQAEDFKIEEAHEHMYETRGQTAQQQESGKTVDFQPNQTLYINNLNEKIKVDGNKLTFLR